MFPIDPLLALARARLKDAAWEREDPRVACQQAAAAMDAAAQAQGWDGDAAAFLREAR